MAQIPRHLKNANADDGASEEASNANESTLRHSNYTNVLDGSKSVHIL